MGTPKTIVQLYHLAHIQMLGALRAIFNLFVADKADFIGFDPDFAGAFESPQGKVLQRREKFYLAV